MIKIIGIIFVCFFCNTLIFASKQDVNFIVGYKTVCFAGKPRTAIAINNQIPGPTLHFKEGDDVTIHVYNHLRKDTTIHWHGILVPWQMDGVEGVSQKGIPPGGVFHYHFILHQAGTYWYHAHAGLQEQQGLYGAFLIDPRKKPDYHYTKDYVIVLSDWSNTCPDQIFANLKKTGDYYDPHFPLQPSLAKFIYDYRKASAKERCHLMSDYQTMQKMRMSIYDISDVAYDAFLLNGQTTSQPWIAPVNLHDVVRLRFIGAAANTIFNVKIQDATMQVVHIQGNDIKPYTTHDFNIAPGETYDVLVNIKKNVPYIIYAESIDTLGAAYGALVTSPCQIVNFQTITPFPEPVPVTRAMMLSMDKKDMHSHPHSHSMASTHSSSISHHMNMSTEPSLIGDSICPLSSFEKTQGTKYQDVVAAVKTNNPTKPVDGVIRMELFGYMDRFIWFINGLPEYKAHPIILEPNKRYRFIFTNTSMMRHPMHLHGHWFILRNGHGSYDPLLHTLDIAPGATVVADVDTDASGQWFFHCHLIYHMMGGMSRTFQYSTLIDLMHDHGSPEAIEKPTAYYNRPVVRVDEIRPIDSSLVHHPMAHPVGLYLANFLDIGEDPFHNTQKLTFTGLYGRDYNKLEVFTNDAEIDKGSIENADVDIFYWHLLNQFWAAKGGVNYFYRPAKTPYWQPGIGIEGLMPYFIDTNVRGYYYRGSTKMDAEFSRDTQITNNFFIRAEIRSILASKTVTQAEIGSGLNQMFYTIRPYYRLMPGLNVFVEYEQQRDYGVFRTMEIKEGESAIQNTLTVGLSMVF